MAKHDPWNPLGQWLEEVMDTAGKAFSEIASAPLDAKNWDFGDNLAAENQPEEASEGEGIEPPPQTPDWYDDSSDDDSYDGDAAIPLAARSGPVVSPPAAQVTTQTGPSKETHKPRSSPVANALVLLVVLGIVGSILSNSSHSGKPAGRRGSIKREIAIVCLIFLTLMAVAALVEALR